MAMRRIRLAADRRMEIRTSLSLIRFGFTVHQAFRKPREAGVIEHAAAPRNFGVA